ncbi:MAG: M28 family peptidase [Bacteroidia bacterium]|nr:M28 family peptidase [Bacteroidia bacterium]
MRFFYTILLFILSNIFYGQDTTYARLIIKKLCSKELLGRGYANNGVNKAASFISKELKTIGVCKFGKSYAQNYEFPVNTFPGNMSVLLDGKTIVAGRHYLIEPSAKSLKMKFQLIKTDSITYQAKVGETVFPLIVKLKKKLTYSVASNLSNNTVIELLKDSFPNDLKTINVNFENKFIQHFKSQNLIGYIKGFQHPDSFIVYTAHYDHLGAMGKDTYFPGANDNASGVSVLLNLARYYQKNPSKYSVVFIFFSGEEAGLLGSKYFSEHPIFPLSKIKFLTNLDLLGTGDDGIMVVNATVFKDQFQKLNQINLNKNYVKQIKQRGKAANSDHYWFTEKGVPSFFIYTMGGIQVYHDIYDLEQTLPLTKYLEVCKLLIDFNDKL